MLGGLERALRHLRFLPVVERVHDDELSCRHVTLDSSFRA